MLTYLNAMNSGLRRRYVGVAWRTSCPAGFASSVEVLGAMRHLALTSTCLAFMVLASGCGPAVPPTVTPGPPATSISSDGSVIEIPVEELRGEVGPIEIEELLPYSDPDGNFSLQIPYGWAEVRPEVEGTASDVKVGAVFQPPTGGGLLTVTQFDNGQRPQSVGATANGILDMTGWREQPGYQELARETPLEASGDALRLEIEYTRASGTFMHSLVLFRIDGTTFSMVNAGVEASSWQANEGIIRDLLESYQVPAAD